MTTYHSHLGHHTDSAHVGKLEVGHGMQVDEATGEAIPRAHLLLHMPDDSATVIVMGPEDWADAIMDMIEAASHLGNHFRGALEIRLRYRGSRYN